MIPKLAIERAIEGGWKDALSLGVDGSEWNKVHHDNRKTRYWEVVGSSLFYRRDIHTTQKLTPFFEETTEEGDDHNSSAYFSEKEHIRKHCEEISLYEIALDPTFWQSLGKALGWGKEPMDVNGKCIHCGVDVNYQPPFESGCNHVHYPEDCKVCCKDTKRWDEIAHDFYDLVLDNQSTEMFWNNLLT